MTWRGELKIASALSLTAASCFSASSAACFFSSAAIALLEHLGVADQVVADNLLDLAALRIGDALRVRRRGYRPTASERRRGRYEQRRSLAMVLSGSGDGRRPGWVWLVATMSSAFTQPGEPIGKPGLGAGRELARGRAVAAHEGRSAEARSAWARSPLRP